MKMVPQTENFENIFVNIRFDERDPDTKFVDDNIIKI